MGRYIRWVATLLFTMTGFTTAAHAGVCEAYDFDTLKTMLQDITKCPDASSPGRYYIELRFNSYIAEALVIPEKTTLRGNLSNNPGKPATLESNFNPDDGTYQSCFGLFKTCGKKPAPECLITLEKGADLQNVQLTKVFAKKAICADSNSIISNVIIDGPSMDLSELDAKNFVAVSLFGSNNILKNVTFTLIAGKGTEVFSAPNATNNLINPPGDATEKPAEPAQPPANSGEAAAPKQDSGALPGADTAEKPANSGAAAASSPADNKSKNGTQPETLGPLQPVVASGADASCSLSSSASAGAPALLFLGILTLAGLMVCRTVPKKLRIRNKERFHD